MQPRIFSPKKPAETVKKESSSAEPIKIIMKLSVSGSNTRYQISAPAPYVGQKGVVKKPLL